MSVRGAWGDFNLLRGQMRSAASGALRDRLLKAAAAEALTIVQLEFKTSTDPDGQAWAPVARGGMPLRKTGRMGNSFTSRATGSGFVVGSNVFYTRFHQDGTSGRKQAQKRFQAVDKRGRFQSKTRASKAKGGSVGVRALSFKEGSGAITPRPMLPRNGQLTPRWRTGIDRAVKNSFANYWSRVNGGAR